MSFFDIFSILLASTCTNLLSLLLLLALMMCISRLFIIITTTYIYLVYTLYVYFSTYYLLLIIISAKDSHCSGQVLIAQYLVRRQRYYHSANLYEVPLPCPNRLGHDNYSVNKKFKLILIIINILLLFFS